MAELVDAPDLGSGGKPWGFESLYRYICLRGEIGRHAGLKIQFFGVWVQVPPEVQIFFFNFVVELKILLIFDPMKQIQHRAINNQDTRKGGMEPVRFEASYVFVC